MKILTIIYVVFTILSVPLVIITALLSPGLSIICFGIVYLLMIAAFIDVIIILIISLFMKNFNKKIYFSSIFLLLMLLFSKPILYDTIHGYHETKKYLQKTYQKEATILSIADKNVHLDFEASNNNCNYTFNVKLKDETNIIFQAGYCDIGTMATYFDGYSNYSYYYVPYYFDKYKENHNISFRLEKSESKYFNNEKKIVYENKEEALDFINYLFNNANDTRYCLLLYNGENKFEKRYCANNKYDEQELEREIQSLKRNY